jgi:hypothetical protein
LKVSHFQERKKLNQRSFRRERLLKILGNQDLNQLLMIKRLEEECQLGSLGSTTAVIT